MVVVIIKKLDGSICSAAPVSVQRRRRLQSQSYHHPPRDECRSSSKSFSRPPNQQSKSNSRSSSSSSSSAKGSRIILISLELNFLGGKSYRTDTSSADGSVLLLSTLLASSVAAACFCPRTDTLGFYFSRDLSVNLVNPHHLLLIFDCVHCSTFEP